MKRLYVPPRCEKSNYELTTFILANSAPQNSPASRSTTNDKNDRSPIRGWGNLWQ